MYVRMNYVVVYKWPETPEPSKILPKTAANAPKTPNHSNSSKETEKENIASDNAPRTPSASSASTTTNAKTPFRPTQRALPTPKPPVVARDDMDDDGGAYVRDTFI